ncbi:ester cyclase [Spirosoma fluviale]|uniref:Predicted ester cyclase n=1 Tax=Spirosoma fluviale TaxID=1597977 RepID=A0A286G1A5_9BACT|nr:ester cyclase [Spirosoma fluviale]SOD89016.1 Predicted ester cyclase [Spirosoma fluviale]
MKSSKYILVAILLLAGSIAVQAQYIAMNTGVAQKNEALIKKNNALTVSTANGRTVVAFFNALLNARDVAFLKTVITPDIHFRNSLGATVEGIDGLVQMMGKMDNNFAGFRIDITEVVSEGDAVFLKANFSGTHSSAFLAPAATGKPFTVPGFARFTLRDGKVAEGFAVADFYQITKQIQ